MTRTFDAENCPIPEDEYPSIVLAHGGGGRLTRDLVDRIFSPVFDNPEAQASHDGAVISPRSEKLAFTTDSYVVRPLFFPGGNIGTLAVNGTVNDLAMCGARPLYMSAGFILEEGLRVETLWRVAIAMQEAALKAGIRIVTGDTKVVEHGRCDGMYINTSGVGTIDHDLDIRPESIRPQDTIILSGDIGRHGVAVMAEREGLTFERPIESDCRPLNGAVLALISQGVEIHCLRDLTRGGLATALVEIASTANIRLTLDESAVHADEAVQGACELLGLDPMYVANEGRFVVVVPQHDADVVLDTLRESAPENTPHIIGSVGHPRPGGLVTLHTAIGTHRVIDMLSGEQLPRIC